MQVIHQFSKNFSLNESVLNEVGDCIEIQAFAILVNSLVKRGELEKAGNLLKLKSEERGLSRREAELLAELHRPKSG